MLNFIVAVSENGVIGLDGKIPWRIPGEQRYFKQVTTPHPIVMGRRTYESIGKPLPGRENYVLTRDQHYQAPGCHVIHSVRTVLDLSTEQEVFVIGGSEVFDILFPHVDKIYLTVVHKHYDGDVSFSSELDPEKWQLVESHEGPGNVVPHTFRVYRRK
jgi:dihydrofolate reductase